MYCDKKQCLGNYLRKWYRQIVINCVHSDYYCDSCCSCCLNCFETSVQTEMVVYQYWTTCKLNKNHIHYQINGKICQWLQKNIMACFNWCNWYNTLMIVLMMDCDFQMLIWWLTTLQRLSGVKPSETSCSNTK